jgi:hypothetical protein
MNTGESTEADRLRSLFERVTGESTVTERQRPGVSHRVYEDER